MNGPDAQQAIGRVVHKVDFERGLATSPRCRSTHFVVHHVASGPSVPKPARWRPVEAELSTVDAPPGASSVDKSVDGLWLGCVVPKRHARRSVTRNLLRRQIRAVMQRHAGRLKQGLWLVRLRAPFSREQFPSAASAELRRVVQGELETLFARAAA